jgi:hypothetical protein
MLPLLFVTFMFSPSQDGAVALPADLQIDAAGLLGLLIEAMHKSLLRIAPRRRREMRR